MASTPSAQVDYAAHMAHAFLLQPHRSPAARTAAAVRQVGVPITSGALSTFLGIGFLALGSMPAI